jgi:hypothetical protein
MNGKLAKKLRKMARLEMLEDPNRDYVASANSRRTMVNSPNSKRAMHLALKREYKKAAKAGPVRHK